MDANLWKTEVMALSFNTSRFIDFTWLGVAGSALWGLGAYKYRQKATTKYTDPKA